MGKKDFRRRESKKPKKDLKKPLHVNILPLTPTAEVEVIKRGQKHKEEEED